MQGEHAAGWKNILSLGCLTKFICLKSSSMAGNTCLLPLQGLGLHTKVQAFGGFKGS